MSLAMTLQWLGAAGVLSAFALSQRGMWSIDGPLYLTTNLVAGVCLCVAAILTAHWGFALLEAAWAAIALRGLYLRGRHAR